MSEILTKEELSALFEAFREPEPIGIPEKRSSRRRHFNRAEADATRRECNLDSILEESQVRLNDAQMAALKALNQSLGRSIAERLSAFLGSRTTAELDSQTQIEYHEYVACAAGMQTAVVRTASMKGPIAIAASFEFLHAAIDRLLGRLPGRATRPEFTEVERGLAMQTIGTVLSAFDQAWDQVAAQEASIAKWAWGTKDLLVALDADPVLMADFALEIDGCAGRISFCLPTQVLKPFLSTISSAQIASPIAEAEDRPVSYLIPLRASVEVGPLQAGDLHGVMREVEISSPDGSQGIAEIVRLGDGFGLRVKSLG